MNHETGYLTISVLMLAMEFYERKNKYKESRGSAQENRG